MNIIVIPIFGYSYMLPVAASTEVECKRLARSVPATRLRCELNSCRETVDVHFHWDY